MNITILVNGEFENCQLCGYAQSTIKIIPQGTSGYLVYLRFTWSQDIIFHVTSSSTVGLTVMPLYYRHLSIHTVCSVGLKRPKDMLASTSIRVWRPANGHLFGLRVNEVSMYININEVLPVSRYTTWLEIGGGI